LLFTSTLEKLGFPPHGIGGQVRFATTGSTGKRAQRAKLFIIKVFSSKSRKMSSLRHKIQF